MSTIYTREKVREVVARALLLDPERGEQAAIEAAAQALALPVECVREAVETVPA
jgi:hypothetical protein